MTLSCDGRIVAVVAVTEIKFMLEVQVKILIEVNVEKKAILENALFSFVTPCIDAL